MHTPACPLTHTHTHTHTQPPVLSSSLPGGVNVSLSDMSDSLWPQALWPSRNLCPSNSPGKNTRVGSHSLFQGIFLTQGWNPGLLLRRQIINWATRWYTCYYRPTLISNHSKFIVYIRIHTWCCTFYGFGQM